MTAIPRKLFIKKCAQAGAGVMAVSLFGVNRSLKGAAPDSRPPNIVFVFGDDWGWGDLGCYGNPRIKTPNIDGLAAEGTRFTQFYVNGPVCSPSRTSVMTGCFPGRFRIHDYLADPEKNARRKMPNYLDPSPPMLPRLLKEAGYTTGHFGKWHLGSGEGAPEPGEYGFDEYKTGGTGNGPTFGNLWGPELRAKSSELIIDETIRFIEKNREKPFYVQAWLLDTHARLMPTEEQMSAYKGLTGAYRIYYSAATDSDRQIGRLLARLSELGLDENTIVIFSADNGPEDPIIGNASEHGVGSAGPFRGQKRSLYEGGVRLPFILRWKGKIPAGKVDNDTILSGVDLLPTLCGAAGARLSEGAQFDGEDAGEVLAGKIHARAKPLMWEWRFRIFGHVINRSPMLSIREGKWKLLMNPDWSRVELYDIPADPSELNNMADRHPEVMKDLAQKALRWSETLPPGPVEPEAGKNDYPWPK